MLETYWIGSPTSLVYVTNWTLVHAISGGLTIWLLPSVSLWTAFLLHSLWELWQVLVGNTPWRTLRGLLDIVMDTVAYMLGVLAGRRISRV